MRGWEKRGGPDTHSVWWAQTPATWSQHMHTPGDARAAARGKQTKEVSVKAFYGMSVLTHAFSGVQMSYSQSTSFFFFKSVFPYKHNSRFVVMFLLKYCQPVPC